MHGSEEHPVLNMFGRDFARLSPRQKDCWLDAGLRYWRLRGFPYPRLSSREIALEFGHLQNVCSAKVIRRSYAVHSTVGLRLANSFHPQMWQIREHGRSPVDRFREDDTLRAALSKAARFWPNRRCWNAQCVRSVFRLLHRSRVANFRPTVARALIEKYSHQGDSVLDFSAGYGGRLLGALTLGRRYVGIDPSVGQIRGCRRMLRALRSLAVGEGELYLGCAEDILPLQPARSVDLILTSPPYYDTERYSNEPTQSYLRYTSYQEWRDQFLVTVLEQSHRTLRKKGHLVINVANAGRYPVADDTAKLGSRIFGSAPNLIKMLMPRLPAFRASSQNEPFKWEPILVFQKKP
jgi:hypothetical protein